MSNLVTPISDPSAVGAALSRRYPDLFGATPVPLKIGIDTDLRARHPEFSRRALSRFLFWWTHGFAYVAALHAGGARRRDLDGADVGEAWVPSSPRSHGVAPRPKWMPEPIAAILATATPEVPLEGAARDLIVGLLDHHPERAEKIGPGLAAVVVDGRYRAFAVVRVDGSRDTFSVRRCLAEAAKRPTDVASRRLPGDSK